MPVKPETVTLYTPSGGIATLPSNILDATDMGLVSEYFGYLDREHLRCEWFCTECRSYGEIDTNRDAADRVVELLFTCQCRTIFGTIRTRPSPSEPSASATPT